MDAEPTRHLGGLAGTGQLGIGRDDGAGVSRQVDLGHDLDISCRGIVDKFLDLRLGVVAARGLAITAGALALAAYLVQLGERVDAQAETLVVAHVEVEAVELEQRHSVYELLHRLHAEKVAADVDHPRPITEAGLVVYRARRQICLTAFACHLQQSDRGVEEPLVRRSERRNALGRDFEDIVPFRISFHEPDAAACVRAPEEGCDGGEIGRHFAVRTEGEAPLRDVYPERFGQYIHTSSEASAHARTHCSFHQ